MTSGCFVLVFFSFFWLFDFVFLVGVFVFCFCGAVLTFSSSHAYQKSTGYGRFNDRI